MARGVSFVEVDLRTGVTKEQSSNNEVSLCSGREWFRSLGQALVGEAGGHERTVLQQRGRPARASLPDYFFLFLLSSLELSDTAIYEP